MGTIIAVNASPRAKWNTGQLVRSAAEGAAEAGHDVEVVDLYSLEPFMGCRSCFACMTEKCFGKCVFKDGLSDTLEKMRNADGIILGSPNYFGRPTAGFRALFERLCFQYLTYNKSRFSCNDRKVPVLFIMTSNAAEEAYALAGYDAMMNEHATTLENFVGPVTKYVSGNTLQTDHYERYDWTMFDIPGKQKRHEEVFPTELAEVREIAKGLF